MFLKKRKDNKMLAYRGRWGSLVLLLCLLLFAGCNVPGQTREYSQSFLAMDTIMTITLYGRDGKALEEAANDVIAEINRLDALLSTGSETSEITQLNEKGNAIVSEDTAVLLTESLALYGATEGAFDITIYPVMRAWGFTSQDFRVPEEGELEALLAKVDAGCISYDSESKEVILPQGVEIDLGGIAKGYTSAKVAELLKGKGVTSAILNLGGNVQTLGTKADGSSWNIAIQDPEDESRVLCAVALSGDEAVVTSGGYQRYFEEEGMTYHHIIDPKTGYPAYNGLTSVSIITRDAALADGLSTALFVMGTEDAIAYYQAHKDEFECVLYDADGTLYISEGLEGKVQGTSDYQLIK